MDFEPDARIEQFRQEVRAFVASNLPPEIAERHRHTPHPSRTDVTTWMEILHRKGWSAVGWPREHGGAGWTGLQRLVFEDECAAADAPQQHFANIHSVGPVIYTYGTQTQRIQFLDRLLRGADFWCQGFSEPNAGSDLASLSTRAVLEGDAFTVNGQKIWTSDALDADWMFALVRTDQSVPAQRGISFLLVDMRSPGITVQPITLLDGSQCVCQVFFSDVRVPVENLIGRPGEGWSIAKFLLMNERAFSAEIPATKRDLRRVIRLAKERRGSCGLFWDDPVFRTRVVRLQVDVDALEYTMLRALSEGDHQGTPLASLLKVPGSELRQRVAELLADLFGVYGLVEYPPSYRASDSAALPGPADAQGVSTSLMFRRATTIYGGTNEIQRDVIARSVLGP